MGLNQLLVLITTLSLTLIQFQTANSQPKPLEEANQSPKWYNFLKKELQEKRVKIGLINIDDQDQEEEGGDYYNQLLHGLGETISVHFDRVDYDHQWTDFFPFLGDQDHTESMESSSSCPEMPMPEFENYEGIGVVVVRVPCDQSGGGEAMKDLFRLQLNLVVANLLVRSNGWDVDRLDRTVHVVFLGSCGPMHEMFRCEDLLFHDGDDGVWIYRPNLRKLRQKALMPVGTCQVAHPCEETGFLLSQTTTESLNASLSRNFSDSCLHHEGEETWRACEVPTSINATEDSLFRPREAYVTVLHSTDAYVCGAIALAQSIIQTNTTRDLVLLADNSITESSLEGLRGAGWKIKHMERIPNPNAKTIAYSEWNYSKLRIWLLTEYDKIMYLDADLLVLKNLDEFFVYPQLSAVADVEDAFNSGIMLIEPSKCTFEFLLEKMSEVESYDGADQGFLNGMFPWWHRLPVKLNRLKLFDNDEDNLKHEIPRNSYVIHYLGLKPWMCQHDYDCNWDIPDLHRFASDSAYRRWMEVYNSTSKRLQHYCQITVQEDPFLAKIRKWRDSYKDDDGNLLIKHWRIFSAIVLFLLSSLFVLQRKNILSYIAHNWPHEKVN